MKFIITAMTLSLSLSALACPDLSGVYNTCSVDAELPESGPALQSLEISQSTNSAGITTYVVTSVDSEERAVETIVADGKPVTEVEEVDGAKQTTTVVTTCGAGSLDMDFNIKLEDPNGASFEMDGQQSVSKSDGAITMNVSLGGTPIQTITCK